MFGITNFIKKTYFVRSFTNKPIVNTYIKNLLKYDKKTGSEIIIDIIKKYTNTVFIYSGGAIMHVLNQFYKNNDFKYYILTHEQFMGHAATAYFRVSNKIAPCFVTSGPGITNMVTPLLDATNDSTPLIVFSGQVPVNQMGTNAFQEAPSVEITRPVTKWSYCVKDILELPFVIKKAIKIATTSKKGSVHIDLPKDITSSKFRMDIEKITEYILQYTEENNNLEKDNNEILIYNEELFKNAFELIATSKKPILLIGQGCNDAYENLRKFAIKLCIPVTTTIHANGVFDETNPLSLKFMGMHGNYTANWAIQHSDCIIAIGNRFDDRTIGNIKYYAPNAKIIFCNNDKNTINCVKKQVKIDYLFYKDCNIFLDNLINIHQTKYNSQIFNYNSWFEYLQKMKLLYYFSYNIPLNNQLNTPMVIEELNRQLYNKDFIITTGVGNHQMMTSQFITWKKPKTFITSGSLGVMGFGLPASIGCQIANPNKLVILIDGDGSFNMSIGELKSVVNYDLPIKILIMNDGTLSMVKTWETIFYNKNYTATHLGKTQDYAKIAESFGIKGINCDNLEDLPKTIQYMLSYDRAIICDFRVISTPCLPLCKPGNALDDMIFNLD